MCSYCSTKEVILLRKMAFILPAAVMILSMSACSAHEAKTDMRNMANQVGYYSTETSNGGNAILLDNQAAPIPHMMNDYRDNAIKRKEIVNNHGGNPTIPISDRDRGPFLQDGDYSRADYNYHNHIEMTRAARSSYYTSYEGQLAEKLAAKASKQEGVKDARVLIYNDQAVISLLINNYNDADEIKKSVQKAVSPLVENKKVYVLTDSGVYHRVLSLDNTLRDGGPRDRIKMDASDLFKNLHTHMNHME